MQYSFYLNTLRKKKRFSPWLRKDKVQDLECVKQYYGYSNEKASQALKILTKEQINFIKQRLDTGGTEMTTQTIEPTVRMVSGPNDDRGDFE